MKAHSMIGGTISQSSHKATRVSSVFGIEENKLVRSQPTTPRSATGGGRSALGSVRT